MGHSKFLTISVYLLVPKIHVGKPPPKRAPQLQVLENETWLWKSMLELRSMEEEEEEVVGIGVTCEFLHFATKQGHEGPVNEVVIVSSDLPKGRRLP